uniref:G-protein coupled receptors family 1 profile domain-containing protein n=1 Tax=Xenopus tropicalis TaxID=8364 RepID=A0A6I8Q8L5_XENTR
MVPENKTSVSDFVLLGLTDQTRLQIILFVCILIIYLLNLTGNFLIMLLIISDPTLHIPMYFFLWNLAFIDICYSSVVVPKMLSDLLSTKRTISFIGCISQIHFFHFLGSSEVMLFSAMSYDRYVAIQNPLRYSSIMNIRLCLQLSLGCLMLGFFHSLLHTLLIAKLPFCGPDVINHFFCDIKPLLKLACTDTSLNFYIIGSVFGLPAFILTLSSYVCIVSTIMKIHSAQGRWKTFSTCVSHLTVVIIFYGTLLIVYMSPITYYSSAKAKSLSLLYTVLIPLCNPLIYTLRNKDVKLSLWKLFNPCLKRKYSL